MDQSADSYLFSQDEASHSGTALGTKLTNWLFYTYPRAKSWIVEFNPSSLNPCHDLYSSKIWFLKEPIYAFWLSFVKF